jgi:hypothetical protein
MSAEKAIFRELLRTLPKTGARAQSARLELEYWRQAPWSFLTPPRRKRVKTTDGKDAEVVLLESPSGSMPGTDFSMAFLLVNRRVVDWASCWTYNRTANQKLLLENVDGDGSLDVAFRATEGFWGLLDERRHTRPGDKRTWLYAYAITSKGFRSLFPVRDQLRKVLLKEDTSSKLGKVRIEGVPTSVREHQMFECRISLTNTSRQDLDIVPGGWFRFQVQNAGSLMTYGTADPCKTLKPGQTVSQTVRLFVNDSKGTVTLRCTLFRLETVR